MTALRFGELPAISHSWGGGRPVAWTDEAAQLRARPGEWALLVTKSKGNLARVLTYDIKTGQLRSFPRGEFEAATRGCDVWVRYVGGAA